MKNLEEMDKSLEKYNFPKLNQEEIENMNKPITSTEIETVIKKIFQQTKVQGQMASQKNSTKNQGRANTYTAQTLPENINSRGRKTPELILQGYHYPDTKTRQRCHNKRKLQANIIDEHRCKNTQQNSGKQNPTTHKKNHTSSRLYPKDGRILQYKQINQCDTPY